MTATGSPCYLCTVCACDGKHYRIMAEHLGSHAAAVSHFRRLTRRLRVIKDEDLREVIIAEWRPSMPNVDAQLALWQERYAELLQEHEPRSMSIGEPLEKVLAASAHAMEAPELFQSRTAAEKEKYAARVARRRREQ